ncbi:hypothetical protein KTO58_13955 [Chitinophaga pendula]|uniref:GNAT family N-acetyltransferase n=1 Tax=Chitinophaga TaxID=79328 RepID=UPI000BAF56DA|nr:MULTISPECIES: GNAT family N-acetyltransferase [Chitinophaga]ASZ12152.1 GNAT family N-acetyltransferase [Chitinophaga sp. MD30]UCJ04808.1 hypothetical protein KTO58_13955 [Chitinophaga pendula]
MADPVIVEKWLKGWALSRNLRAPVKNGSGFRVDVGWLQQKARYVFPNVTDEWMELANTIVEPWIFLKLCAAPEIVKDILPSRWVIQPLGFMMTCRQPMSPAKANLMAEYIMEIKDEMPVAVVRILTTKGDIAAIGRLVFVEDIVVYDRIETHIDHRRKGLATIVLKTLEKIAVARNPQNSVLVATAAGKALYETLGWSTYSLYTSIVIPANPPV